MPEKVLQTLIVRGLKMADELADETIQDLIETGADELIKYVNETDNLYDNEAARLLAKRGSQFFVHLNTKLNA